MIAAAASADKLTLSTLLGKVKVEVVNAAKVIVTGQITVHSAQYTVELTLYRQTYGWHRRSFDDLVLTPLKAGAVASFPDRERVIDVLMPAVNDWSETPAGVAALAAPPPQQHSTSDLKRGDL